MVQWVYGTPKSDASTDRVVPLAPWLADELREYLTQVHPFAGNKRLPNAPLFPGGAIAMSSIGLSRCVRRPCTSTTCSLPRRPSDSERCDSTIYATLSPR